MRGDYVVVNWSASDPGSGLDTCDLEMSTDGRTWESLSNDCAGSITPAGVLAGQPYTFRLTATDNTGNTASAEDGAATAAVTKYYYFGSQRVAMRKPDGAVNWLHGDHLGSTSLATDGDGVEVSRQSYYPFGEVRWTSDTPLPTDFGYTGQRLDGTGLMFYHARYYAPTIGRFVQADTIIPDPGSPQDFNRYAYVRNNPLNGVDPTGHKGVFGIKEWIEGLSERVTEWTQAKSEALASSVQSASDSLATEIQSTNDGLVRSLNSRGDSLESSWQAMGIASDWFFETGDQTQWFGPDEPLTQEVMNDPMMDQFREAWAAEGYPVPWQKTQPVGGAKEFIVENIELGLSLVGLGTPGGINAVGGVLGSFTVFVEDAGDGMLMFEVYNKTGFKSGTRVPGTDISLIQDRDRTEWGPGGTLEQYCYWWEPTIYSSGGSSGFD